MNPIQHRLREALLADRRGVYAISRHSRVPFNTLAYFCRGRGLSRKNVAKLLPHVDPAAAKYPREAEDVSL